MQGQKAQQTTRDGTCSESKKNSDLKLFGSSKLLGSSQDTAVREFPTRHFQCFLKQRGGPFPVDVEVLGGGLQSHALIVLKSVPSSWQYLPHACFVPPALP